MSIWTRWILSSLVSLLFVFRAAPAAAQDTYTLTIYPTEDASIRRNSANSNFGTNAKLEAKSAGTTSQWDFLLKIPVTGVDGNPIQSATLYLRAADGSGRGGDFYQTTNFTESTVTWNTAPAATGGLVASLGAVTAGTTYTINLLPVITGNGTYNFRVRNTPTDTLGYHSSEATTTSNRPRLVLVVRRDIDQDGILDSVDNCPGVANTSQSNNDGDAQGDACDSDDDNDGAADGADNCPLLANPAQTNTDSDAQGDACDADDDNDAIADGADNCPLLANPAQTGGTPPIQRVSEEDDYLTYSPISVSADGRYVAYTAHMDNGQPVWPMWCAIHDRSTGATLEVRNDINDNAKDCAISRDGQRVVYMSDPNWNDAVGSALYMKDLTTGTTYDVSGNHEEIASTYQMSGNGRFVAYIARDPNGQNGFRQVFVYDSQTGSREVASCSSGDCAWGNADSIFYYSIDISDDGRFVAFNSKASNLVAGDTNSGNANGGVDVFLRDRQSGLTERINVTTAGLQQNGGTSFDPHVSDDGRYVLFHGAAWSGTPDLVSDGTSPQGDVYLRDRQGQTTVRVNTVDPSGGSSYPDLSPDGRFATYYSNKDQWSYDAKVHDLSTGQTADLPDADLQYARLNISGSGSHVAFMSEHVTGQSRGVFISANPFLPFQADNDGDDQGDACDSDDDNDGIEDGADNCPLSANPDQLDWNSDGQGDACDPPPPPQLVFLDASPFEFGATAVGTTRYETVTIQNQGSTAAPFVNVVGLYSNFYLYYDTCSGGLEPGATCFAYLSFTPTTQGFFTDTLSVYHSGGSMQLELQGQGIDPAQGASIAMQGVRWVAATPSEPGFKLAPILVNNGQAATTIELGAQCFVEEAGTGTRFWGYRASTISLEPGATGELLPATIEYMYWTPGQTYNVGCQIYVTQSGDEFQLGSPTSLTQPLAIPQVVVSDVVLAPFTPDDNFNLAPVVRNDGQADASLVIGTFCSIVNLNTYESSYGWREAQPLTLAAGQEMTLPSVPVSLNWFDPTASYQMQCGIYGQTGDDAFQIGTPSYLQRELERPEVIMSDVQARVLDGSRVAVTAVLRNDGEMTANLPVQASCYIQDQNGMFYASTQPAQAELALAPGEEATLPEVTVEMTYYSWNTYSVSCWFQPSGGYSQLQVGYPSWRSEEAAVFGRPQLIMVDIQVSRTGYRFDLQPVLRNDGTETVSFEVQTPCWITNTNTYEQTYNGSWHLTTNQTITVEPGQTVPLNATGVDLWSYNPAEPYTMTCGVVPTDGINYWQIGDPSQVTLPLPAL